MFLTYEKYYFKYGIRRISDFTKPLMEELNLLGLPRNSLLHYMGTINTFPDKQVPLLKFVSNVVIYNQMKYINNPHEARILTINENSIIKKCNKKHLDFESIRDNKFDLLFTKNVVKLKTTLPVITYDSIVDNYKYSNNRFNAYYRFVNKYTTLVNSINTYNKTIIPKMIYTMEIYKKFITLEKPTDKMLKIFINEQSLAILEILKLLNKETATKSIFYSLIKSGSINHTNIILRKDDKGIILNLSTLLSFSKDWEEFENEHKIGGEVLLRLLHTMLSTVSNYSRLNEISDTEKVIKDFTHSSDDTDETISSNLMKYLKVKAEDDDDINDAEVSITKEEIVNEDNLIEKIDNLPKDIPIKEITPFVTKYSKDINPDNVDDIDVASLKTLDNLKENKEIDSIKYNKLKKILSDTLNKPSPYGDDLKIKDYIQVKAEDIVIKDVETAMPAIPNTLINKNYAKDTLSKVNDKYMSKVYKKNIISTFMNLQKKGIFVKDIKVETHNNILGKYYFYSVEVSDKGRSTYTLKLKIPHIYKDGSYKMSGNKYRLKTQRRQLPIVKIDFNKVALNSGYGKINIFKAPLKKYDKGHIIRRELHKLSLDDVIGLVTLGNLKTRGLTLPYDYTIFGRYVKSFTIKTYTFFFNYQTREDLFDKIDLKQVEGTKYTVVGITKTKEPLVMDNENNIHIYSNKEYNNIGNLYTISGIDKSKLKEEYSIIKIFKNYIPTIFLLGYYLGLEEVFNYLNLKYEILEGNKRVNEPGTMVFKLNSSTIVTYPTTDLQKIIISGLNDKPKLLKEMTLEMFNNRNFYGTIFKILELNLVTVTEIKLLEDMFVDTNTELLLKEMKEPTTFIGLLRRSSELLTDDLYEDPRGMNTDTLKGYDRIPQFIHKALVDSLKVKTNEEFFGRSRLTINPYAIWSVMNEDSGSELVDDLNPMAYIKQKEDVTYLGHQGKSKEIITNDNRAYNQNDIGVISESVKDSTDVGITAHLVGNPLINNTVGMVGKKDITEMDWSNILSTNTLASPFLMTDDPKRIIYSGIQTSHVIALDNPKVFPVRSEYDTLIIYKLPPKFGNWAKEDGVVISVSTGKIIVKYKTLGKITYTYQDWSSKEESGLTFNHKMRGNVIKDQKVSSGDILYYDLGFFEPDMFDNTKVVFRTGTYARISLVEIAENYEDAFLIDKDFAKAVSKSSLYIRDLTLNVDDNIRDLVNVNDKINDDDLLFIITTGLVGDEKLTDETMDLLKGFVKSSPKAKYSGTITKMEVYYNSELKDLSNSMKKLVTMSKPYMIDDTDNSPLDGRVDSSYSINGKPLDAGKIHIKYYIESSSGMRTGDKGIVGLQLKTTLTNIAEAPVKNEFGDIMDLEFSYTGIYNRITPSADLTGTTALVLDALTKKVLKMYKG